MQEVSGVYTSPFLHRGERKMALRARKFPGLSRNGPQENKGSRHMEWGEITIICGWFNI